MSEQSSVEMSTFAGDGGMETLPTMSPYLSGMAEHSPSPDAVSAKRLPVIPKTAGRLAMINESVLLKTIAAFAITAAFGSAGFAEEFTVHQGKRYRATLTLNSVERLADNALIARKFRALGFTSVQVSGAGAMRRVEGVWSRKNASAALPRQIVSVATLW